MATISSGSSCCLLYTSDSLVKLSRLENGIISLSPQQAALQPLLESVVEQYTAKASEKGLALQMQDTDAFAVFDFKWTAEALANICLLYTSRCV